MIELKAHDPAWLALARLESNRISTALGELLVAVHHIGSTSIPGIAAKPLIDLMPVARELASIDANEDAIRALGFDWRGEFGIEGRRFCTLDDPATGKRLFNVHFFDQRSPHIAGNLAFRDYLREHPDERRQYEAEKQRAAAMTDDVLTYSSLKSDWVRACVERAVAWMETGGY